MLSGISFANAMNDLGRFVQRATEIPLQTRAALEREQAFQQRISGQIVQLAQKNKAIYVNDVAVDPQAKHLVSFLM